MLPLHLILLFAGILFSHNMCAVYGRACLCVGDGTWQNVDNKLNAQ